jgi:hypothetical protein
LGLRAATNDLGRIAVLAARSTQKRMTGDENDRPRMEQAQTGYLAARFGTERLFLTA